MALFRRKEIEPTPQGSAHIKPNGLVASARQINLSNRAETKIARKTQQQWQQEAIDRYFQVPEIGDVVDRFAKSISKLNLYPGVSKDPKLPPEPITDPQALDAIERLKRPYSSHGRFLWKFITNWLVTGEAYIHASSRGSDDERWDVYSISELEPKSDHWVLTDDTGASRKLGKNDFVLRAWMPNAFYSSKADSPLSKVLDPAEELLLLSKSVRASLRSRLPAGLFLVPQELSFGAEDPTESGDASKNPFLKELADAASAALQNEGSAAALVPVMIEGPAEILKAFQYVPLHRPIDEMVNARTEWAERRLAHGLPLPLDAILGVGDTAGWAAWQITETEFKQYMEPIADAMMDALTVGYFWPAMGLTGKEPNVPVMWYDASRLIVRPDRSKDLDEAHARIVVSDSFWRSSKGIPENAAPDDEEIARRIMQQRGTLDPILTEAYIKKFLGQESGMERPDPQVGPQNEENKRKPTEENPSTPKDRIPDEPGASHSVPIEQTRAASAFEQRLMGACDAACRRAIEKAGARLRNLAKKDERVVQVISAKPNRMVAAVLGSAKIQEMGVSEDQLIDGSFSDLKEQFLLWTEKYGRKVSPDHPAWHNLSGRLAVICKHGLYAPLEDLEPLVTPVVAAALHEVGLVSSQTQQDPLPV